MRREKRAEQAGGGGGRGYYDKIESLRNTSLMTQRNGA
jgi:hypothetical protein